MQQLQQPRWRVEKLRLPDRGKCQQYYSHVAHQRQTGFQLYLLGCCDRSYTTPTTPSFAFFFFCSSPNPNCGLLDAGCQNEAVIRTAGTTFKAKERYTAKISGWLKFTATGAHTFGLAASEAG